MKTYPAAYIAHIAVWTALFLPCGSVRAADPREGGSALETRLDALTLVRIAGTAPIEGFLHGVGLKCVELAPEGQGINLVLLLTEKERQSRITMDLSGKTPREALRALCEQADLRFTVEQHAVIVAGTRPCPGPTLPGESSIPASVVLRLKQLINPFFESGETITAHCSSLVRRHYYTNDGWEGKLDIGLAVSSEVERRRTSDWAVERVPLYDVIRYICADTGLALQWDAKGNTLRFRGGAEETQVK